MLFIIEVVRLLWFDKSVAMKLLQVFSHSSLAFFKDYKSLLDYVLGKDGLICDDFGWWIRFNKFSDGVNDIDIGHG